MYRLERHLADVISPAELAVISALLGGESYRAIARRGGTSVRTIANQIGSVFRRLEVA